MEPIEVALHEIQHLLIDIALESPDPLRDLARLVLRTRNQLLDERRRRRLRSV